MGLRGIGPAPGGGSWSPGTLFNNGEQGFFFVNDISTMYQDSAGTIPAALEQPLGKWLDQSGRGNHATQPTSANRPTVTALYNLLTKTEQFDQNATGTGAPWLLSATGFAGISANTTLAPDGTLTGDTVTVNLTTHALSQQVAVSPGASYKFVWHAKDATFAPKFSIYNVSAAANIIAPSAYPAGTPIANGWMRYEATVVIPAGCTLANFYPLRDSGTTGSIVLWGADVRLSIHAIPGIPAYQRVNTGTDYDSTGFPIRVKFNGTNQWMQTGSLDLTGTDKMTVFAGVTKLSDAATGAVYESGAGAVPPEFALYAATNSYTSRVFGVTPTINDRSLQPFAAPVSNVVTQALDTAQATAALQNQCRVNGVAAGGSSSLTGAAAFANQPVSIACRGAGGSLFLNGDIYCLGARGAVTTDTQIAQAERYINGRMGGVY